MIPLVHYITLYERYHFFGPPCMLRWADFRCLWSMLGIFLSVLWHCWSGDRNGIRHVKNPTRKNCAISRQTFWFVISGRRKELGVLAKVAFSLWRHIAGCGALRCGVNDATCRTMPHRNAPYPVWTNFNSDSPEQLAKWSKQTIMCPGNKSMHSELARTATNSLHISRTARPYWR